MHDDEPMRQLEEEARRWPRFNTEYGRCPVCGLGPTAIRQLDTVFWPLCTFCGVVACEPMVRRFDSEVCDYEMYEDNFLDIAAHDVIDEDLRGENMTNQSTASAAVPASEPANIDAIRNASELAVGAVEQLELG